MTHLHKVEEGFNKFCGPAVLSILTGRNTDECARVIRSINGQYEVAGVQLEHLLKAADKLGYNSEKVFVAGSLYRTLVGLAHLDANGGIYVITVPSHFVVVEVNDKKEIFFCDNHTKEPIRAASSARLMQPCLACYKVERRKDYVEPEPLRKLSSEISVTLSYRIIDVYRNTTYNHAENNKKELLGTLVFNNEDEIKEFIESVESLGVDII